MPFRSLQWLATARPVSLLERVGRSALAIGLLAAPATLLAQSAVINPASAQASEAAESAPGVAEATGPAVKPALSHTGPDFKPPVVTDASNPDSLDFVVQKPLLGGLSWRRELAERGITLYSHYIAQAGANDGGYQSSGYDYAHQIDWAAAFDLGKLGVLPAAVVRFAMEERAGHNLTDRTGGYFLFQNVYGQGEVTRLSEVSFEKLLINNHLSVKSGFYALGNDFGTLPYTCNFTNTALCGHPMSVVLNSGWQDAPTGKWGARILWKDPSGWYAELGAFEVNPTGTQPQHAFTLDLSHATGVIVPFEAGYISGRKPGDYSGTYKVGFYFDTSNAPDRFMPSREETHRTGGYVQIAQQVYKRRPNLHEGLAVFAVASYGDEATSLLRSYFEAGLSYRGAIRGRGDDTTSVGWTRANINSQIRRRELADGREPQFNEQVIELNHTFQLLGWLYLRPQVEWSLHPSGYVSRGNPTIYGISLQLTL